MCTIPCRMGNNINFRRELVEEMGALENASNGRVLILITIAMTVQTICQLQYNKS